MKQRALRILWPAFLVAGVLEMLVFAVMDPRELRWFGGPLIGWAPLAIYSVTFLMFWVGIAASGALTALLSLSSEEVNALGEPGRSAPESPPSGPAEPPSGPG
ncbi:MAG: hypothetical protein ACXWCU_14630 [Caldimonas sp.]